MSNRQKRLIYKVKTALKKHNDDKEAVMNELVGMVCPCTKSPYSHEDVNEAVNHVLMFCQ